MAKRLVVTVQEGKVKGVKKKSEFSATEYYSFFGVPYGQNTGGMARFKDPVKVKPWRDILDAASESKDGCYQFSVQYNKIIGSEDCLYNNIHTSSIPKKGDPLKAVIVDIHPGGWFHGSPETWYYGSPDYIMHRDIVYVCIGYRLHILGFLNLGLNQCSGNQGLKDIILSLQWIKQNISAFGGDPSNVTMLGNSCGSFNVQCLLLSPKAKGLFHKAVMMGGDVFNPISVTLDENENVRLAEQTARELGYKDNIHDKLKLLRFLKKISPAYFVNMRPDRKYNQMSGTPFPGSPFRPTKDQGENAVLPEPCRELITSMAKVPLLFGICEKEAAMGFIKGRKNTVMKNFVTGLRHSCNSWARDITEEEAQFIKEKIEAFYCNGQPIETAPLSLLVDIQTDMGYSDVYPTLLNVISKDFPSSVYVYKFTFEGSACNAKETFLNLLDEPIKGTIHAEDFSYWAYVPHHSRKDAEHLTPETIEMIHTFTKIITTFAKNGDPNNELLKVHWNPSTIDKPCYMKIDSEMELVDGKFNGERMKFWEDLRKELNKLHKY